MTLDPGQTARPVRDHQFEDELSGAATGPERLELTDLREVKLGITADLGQSVMVVRDVLELRRGSVVTLDKLAGEMTDLYINGVPFAKGEVVVLADSLHVRIAEVRGAAESDAGRE